MIELLMIVTGLIGWLWIAPMFVARKLMRDRGRSGGAGLGLGFVLGWLGVLIAACLSTDPATAR